jgi:hypothetical protein
VRLSRRLLHDHVITELKPADEVREMADIVLPVASAFEREGLKIGFDISTDAQTMVQLRPAVVPPRGQTRSDTDIILRPGRSVGVGRCVLGRRCGCCPSPPTGAECVTLEQLRAHPSIVRCPACGVAPRTPSWNCIRTPPPRAASRPEIGSAWRPKPAACGRGHI